MWLNSWLAEQEVRGSIPRLATWISEIGYLLLLSRNMAEIPLKRRKVSIQPTVPPSVCHRNFNLAHIFWSINEWGLIFSMCYPCDKPFQLATCHDRDLYKNFNLIHIIWSINDRVLMFGMYDPCNKPFELALCLDLHLRPTSRSNLLHFSEFACSELKSILINLVWFFTILKILNWICRYWYSNNVVLLC